MLKKFLLGILLVLLMGFVGCATSQVSNIIVYDNSVIMSRPYDRLSQDVVRLELSQVESSGISLSTNTATTRTLYDRILGKCLEVYPNTDAVLIVSLEAVAKSSSTMVSSSAEYTYVANVYPIKYTK